MGDLTNDLSGKRGHVTGTDNGGGDLTTIKGLAPLSELSDYQTRLRSVTGGQGSYSIDFSHYAPVPGHTQAQLVSKHKQPVEEEQ
jgi:elongation factor G